MGLCFSAATMLCECACCLACCSCKALCNGILGQMARAGHMMLLVGMLVLSALMGKYAVDKLESDTDYLSNPIDLSSGCDSGNLSTCHLRQMIYRGSLAIVVVYVILIPLVFCSDSANKGHWPLKIMSLLGLFIAFWFGDNSSFSQFSEAARVFSFFWLLVQSLLLFDFAHDMHDLVTAAMDEASKDGNDGTWKVLYLLLAASGYALSAVGLGFMYKDYAGCSVGTFFITLTLVVGVITSLLSLWDKVNLGILTPAIMFAYLTFMCWYALLQSPDTGCNPTADGSHSGLEATSMTIIIVISLIVLFWMMGSGSKILTIFNPEGTGAISGRSGAHTAAAGQNKGLNAVLTGGTTTQPTSTPAPATGDNDPESSTPLCGGRSGEDSSPPQERSFFFLLLVIAAMYGCMILTSWGASNGQNKQDNARVANESMWLIIVTQWLTMVMYFKSIQVAYSDNSGN